MPNNQLHGVQFRRSLLAVAITAVLPLATAGADDSTTELDTLDVWATEVKASSVYLDGDAISHKQADHVSDLLRTLPGVDVGGAHSLNQRITIRSMDDKDLRISIDGANQNTYMYHHMGNLQIHADILQAVDVEVGTNSVIHGGLGGAVRFETKTAKQLLKKGEKAGGMIRATYGDNASNNVAITGFAQLNDHVDVLAYHNVVKRKNYAVGGGKIKDQEGVIVPGTDGKVRGLKGDLGDTLLKFGWDLDAHQRLELGYEAYQDEGDYSYRPDMGLATDLAITNNLQVPLLWPTEFTRDTVTLNYDAELGNTFVKATAFHNTSELSRDESGWQQNPAFAKWAAQINGEAVNSGVNVLAETETGPWLLTYGGEWIQYDTTYVSTATADGKRTVSEEDATHRALYLQGRYQLNDQLAVIPGVRHSAYQLDSKVVDDDFSDTTGALAAEFQPSDRVLLKASITQLFKGPEIGEVFTGAGSGDTPNADIKAETGANKELSIAFQDSLLGADRFTAGLTYFDTDINGYIYDGATPPDSVDARSWKDNVGDMAIDGVEAYVGYDRGNLRTLLTYSDADSELDAFSQYASLEGARLDRKQGATISLNVDYDLPEKQMTLHWDLLHVDGLSAHKDLDGASEDNAKDGFTVHNISARWEPSQVKGLALSLGIDNLFDEFYASQSSRTGLSVHPRFGKLYLQDYEPGRNVKLTAAYDF